MFTWICPQCGREVPPSYNDCPDCAAKAQAQPPAVQPEAAPPRAASPDLPPPRAARAPATVVAPALPPLQPTPARTTLPTWLMAIVSALAFVGIGAAAFFTLQYFQKQPAAPARSAAPLENPALASAPSTGRNPLLKHVEVAGLRLTQNKAKQTEVRFVVINHSGADLQNLSGDIDLRARTSKQDEEPVGTFAFKIPALGPYESREVTTVLKTKLKVYELPDWQNLDHRLQLTAQ